MKKLFVFLPFAVLLFVLLSMRPVPDANKNNVHKISGLVSDIYLAGTSDIVLKLIDDNHFYYITRGVEEGLDYTQLKAALLYKDVKIEYVRHWSILNASGSVRPIYQLHFDDDVVYSSWK